MAHQIIYDTRPLYLQWCAHVLNRGAPYDDNARCFSVLDMKEDGSHEILAVVVFHKWNTLKHVELDIASNGKSNWASRKFLGAIYDYVFNHAGCNRMNLAVEASNTSALNM